MTKNTFSEKLNIILIVLLFVIPLISLNLSYKFLSKINNEWALKEQEREAIQEAETLSSEADFSLQIESNFGKFFETIKSDDTKVPFDIDYLVKTENKIFSEPFPKYNLYVFKHFIDSSKTELLYYKGDLKNGKRYLCQSFEYLYKLNKNIDIDSVKKKNNDTFAKMLLGKYANIPSIAKDLRGISTLSNGIHKASWFIWDYVTINDNKEVLGAFLLCSEVKDSEIYGRLLALKNLQKRGKAAGAFLPVYKDYGEACIPAPLNRSQTFLNWAKNITIQNKYEIEKWLKESLPQRVPLGKYTGFCHLGRGSTHVAVVLVKSVGEFRWPKWLIFFNILFILILLQISIIGVAFNKWPQMSLTTRFTLSYILASIIPLSLLCVTAYGYMRQYTNTVINQSISDLQSALKSFDYQKSESVKKYKEIFTKALNDEILIRLIKEEGFKNESVSKRVIDIFENNGENLPVLGVKILDENGDGAFSKGTAPTNYDIKAFFNSVIPSQIQLLRNKLIEEDPEREKELNEDVKGQEESLDNITYESFTGNSLRNNLNKHFSVPIPRKNGNFTSTYYIFDFIRIDNKVKYMLFVIWDDKTIDDKIIQNAFDNYYTLENNNKNHSFLACRIKGQSLKKLGEKTQNADQDVLEEATKRAKQTINSKKTDTFMAYNHLFVAMPSLNFNQTVFVGWIKISDISERILKRINIFVGFIAFSFFILWFCSKRSASVFLEPISALKRALDEVTIGNLKVGFKNESKDELGVLSKEFSQMINGLRERERLSKIISDQALQAIEKHSNNLLNDTETFKGVALVSDIRNFTGISEKYDPTIITDLLNEHFAEMTKIISENGGLIYKFIGDAIEAVFPENTDLKENALERAFKAGCMMITKLTIINKRREKIGLFPYKIGVGLCYGTMWSGTVGSLETRLDYAILGDPLKKAAKYEALSIQNPELPIVFGEDIAKVIKQYGFSSRNIDSKGQNFTVCTIANINNNAKENSKFINYKSDYEKISKEETENYSIFPLQTENKVNNYNYWLNSIILILITITILLGSNTVFYTKLANLKDESENECQRLISQLNCDERLKSAFESICLDYFENIRNALIANNTRNSKQIIDDISSKYEKSGRPIPYYCCCLYKDKSYEIDQICSSGFSPETCQTIASLAFILKKDKINSLRKERKEILKSLMGNYTDDNILKSFHYRRSAVATIDNKELYIDLDKIFDKDHNDILAYVFCGMPVKSDDISLPNYYTSIAPNHVLLAVNKNNKWYFSNNYSEKEQTFIKNNYDNENLIREKGYLIKSITIGNEKWVFYSITKDLASSYRSITQFNIHLVLIIISLYALLAFLFKKVFVLWKTTIAVKLRTDIISSSILPLLIVCFVSYLYANEDYNVQKSEVRLKLNKLMDEIEYRELYYKPLCQTFLRKLSRSEDIQKLVSEANNTENENKKKEILTNLRVFFKNNIIDSNYKSNEYFGSKNPFFLITDILVVGKNDWIAGISKVQKDENLEENHISNFAMLTARAGRSFFLNKTNSDDKVDVNEAEEEIIADKLLEGYGSMFGSTFPAKLISYIDNLIYVSVTFTTVGVYVVPLPSVDNPDCLILTFVFFENEFRPHICNMKNDVFPYKKHIEANGTSDKLYCFYSPNTFVGEYFFYDNGNKDFNYNNKREDLKTVKELLLASSWINSSYLPISRKVDLYSPHLLEARKGNFVSDNIYIALASEEPLRQNALNNILDRGAIIILSILMICFIAQIIILDLLEPIKQLIYGARSAAKGDYKYRIIFSRKDELGDLCNSFNKMMKGLEEKQLMNSMVSKSAQEVASNLDDNRSKKINAVLMYVSVPGFDKIMKSLSSDELFMKLKEQISIIAEIVTQNGGDIDKIMGEKMLIAFHSGNKTLEETAVTASKAARLIETEPKLHFKVAVGVNYGQVISGYLGVGEKRDFTIIGDPVNVTARIASFAEKLDSNRCIVSEEIMFLIKNEIKTEFYKEVQFKGKTLPAKVYRLV